eukprot:gb/GEZN01012789.1/.p1 GENE.gb/GEZN01012789.1/~~gb/GEZN01012789.1/.p1  ORF type:complete len:197 (+),score=6.58 gb/GEZN01012789.1/:112-702(+)
MQGRYNYLSLSTGSVLLRPLSATGMVVVVGARWLSPRLRTRQGSLAGRGRCFGASAERQSQETAVSFGLGFTRTQLEMAAAGGQVEAMEELGRLRWTGCKNLAIECDLPQAFDLTHRAAAAGHPEAQCTLGTFYRYGIGTKQNLKECLRWWRTAAILSHAGAHYKLGDLYIDGIGVDRDIKKALEYYNKGAMIRYG